MCGGQERNRSEGGRKEKRRNGRVERMIIKGRATMEKSTGEDRVGSGKIPTLLSLVILEEA